MVTVIKKIVKNNKKEEITEKRKSIFVGLNAYQVFRNSAKKADRNYDPHLVRLVAFYEKWKGLHPDEE